MPSADRSTQLTIGTWIAGIVWRWRLIAKVVAVTLIAAAVAAIVVPPVYRTHASFVTNSSSAGKLAGMLGGTSGVLGGLATQLGMGSVDDPSMSPNFYTELIRSDELSRRLVNSRFADPRTDNPHDSASLVDILRVRSSDPDRRVEMAMKKMAQSITVDYDGKTNLVNIYVDARWAELSAAIAQRTIDLVTAFNKEQRNLRSSAKRAFLSARLDSARMGLARTEDQQRMFYDQNRSWQRSPQLVIEQARIQRNLELATDLVLTLQRQFEAARLDEISDAALITPVDPPVRPRKALWPRYWLLLASALATGTILGILVAGCAVILADWRARNPATATELSDSFAHIPFPAGRRRRLAESARIGH